MKHILFFGVKEDLLTMLGIVESKGLLKYVRTGNFSKDEIKDDLGVVYVGGEIPNLGKASADSSISCEQFLVCERKTAIHLRSVDSGCRGERVCIDQLLNPDSVTFTPAGIWAHDVVLHGRIATASDSEVSQALMKRFQAAIK